MSTAGEATEVSLLRVCTLQVCPWTDNLLVVLERQRERERERETRVKARLKEFICQLKLYKAPAQQHHSAFSNHRVANMKRTKRH